MIMNCSYFARNLSIEQGKCEISFPNLSEMYIEIKRVFSVTGVFHLTRTQSPNKTFLCSTLK